MSKKIGRPTTKTDANVLKIMNCLQNGLSRSSACATSGIPIRTFNQWVADDESFRLKVEESEEIWLGIVEDKKGELVKEKHWGAIEKELKSRRASVYGDKTELTQKIDIQANIKSMTDEELQEFIKNNV